MNRERIQRSSLPACEARAGRGDPLLLLGVVSVILLGFLIYGMFPKGADGNSADRLVLYCAAGIRPAMEKVAEDYEDEYGVRIELQFGGSNTLLSQIKVAKTGDLYLAADDSYIELARKDQLVAESVHLADMVPVLAVQKGNPKNIQSIQDLVDGSLRIAMGNPDQAAIGKKARKLLTASGDWEAVEKQIQKNGVYKPTVPEVANDVKIGSVDAGIMWDAVANQYGLDAVRTPELDKGLANITIGIMESATSSAEALRFARFAGASDRGLKRFSEFGYAVGDGDEWARKPQLTFFAGAVNRRALEPIVKRFQEREGVDVNTVYNGCGILTGQMESIRSKQENGFPDIFMACDVYYLEKVQQFFKPGVTISNADIVLVTQKGNPKDIKTLSDLARSGVRLALGQPKQCTIGVLSKQLLEKEGIYEQLLKDNIKTHTASSAELVPKVALGTVDAALAYKTDTTSEKDKIEVIPLDSSLAKAVQPYSIAKTTKYPQLCQRLLDAIVASRKDFENAGFRWAHED